MNDNTSGYNAPSREAIFRRLHKLAYGIEWQYNFEDFVSYDVINRTPEPEQPGPELANRRYSRPTRLAPCPPPAIIIK